VRVCEYVADTSGELSSTEFDSRVHQYNGLDTKILENCHPLLRVNRQVQAEVLPYIKGRTFVFDCNECISVFFTGKSALQKSQVATVKVQHTFRSMQMPLLLSHLPQMQEIRKWMEARMHIAAQFKDPKLLEVSTVGRKDHEMYTIRFEVS